MAEFYLYGVISVRVLGEHYINLFLLNRILVLGGVKFKSDINFYIKRKVFKR